MPLVNEPLIIFIIHIRKKMNERKNKGVCVSTVLCNIQMNACMHEPEIIILLN